MLYFRGIVNEFHDLDIMVLEEQAPVVKDILFKMGKLQKSEKGIYETTCYYEFVVDGVDIDVMGGFKIRNSNEVYDCSLKIENIDQKVMLENACISLESLSNWRRYYQLMGRTGKVEMIDSWEQTK